MSPKISDIIYIIIIGMVTSTRRQRRPPSKYSKGDTHSECRFVQSLFDNFFMHIAFGMQLILNGENEAARLSSNLFSAVSFSISADPLCNSFIPYNCIAQSQRRQLVRQSFFVSFLRL